MTDAPIMSLVITNDQDVASLRNAARLSAEALCFPLTGQARIGWAVANLARLMLTLGYHDSMTLARIEQDQRRGLKIACSGRWLRLVQATWIERTAISDISQWVDQFELRNEGVPSLTITMWAPNT